MAMLAEIEPTAPLPRPVLRWLGVGLVYRDMPTPDRLVAISASDEALRANSPNTLRWAVDAEGALVPLGHEPSTTP